MSYPRHLLGGGLPLFRDTVDIYYSPTWLGNISFEYTSWQYYLSFEKPRKKVQNLTIFVNSWTSQLCVTVTDVIYQKESYNNPYLKKSRLSCLLQNRGEFGCMRLRFGTAEHLRNIFGELCFFAFFSRETDTGPPYNPGAWPPSRASTYNGRDLVLFLLLTADSADWRPTADCLGLKTTVVIYFSEANTLFLHNSHGISAVFCLP